MRQNKKRWALLLSCMVLLSIACLVCLLRLKSGSDHPQTKEGALGNGLIADPANYIPRGELTEQKVIDGYTVNLYSDFEEPFISCIEILKGSERVFVKEGFRFFFGDTSSCEQKSLSSGIDLLGDGVPNIVVSSWSGGAHGMYTVNIFSLGDSFRYTGEIDTVYGGGRGFVDCDNQPGFEFELLDWNFANWNCCFAESPAPRVIFSYGNGEFRPDLELMREPAETFKELEEYAHRNGLIIDIGEKYPSPQVKLWSTMLDLIYSGNMAEAWRFFYYCWPGKNHGKRAEFLKEFVLRLKSGSYWPVILELNELQRVRDLSRKTYACTAEAADQQIARRQRVW